MNLDFNIEGNSADFVKNAEQYCAAIRAIASEAEQQSKKVDSSFSLMTSGVKYAADKNDILSVSFKKVFDAIGGKEAIKDFVSEVVRVRGEFQQLEVAFGTLLGSKEKANTLMSQIMTIASESPFDVAELAAGAKQLLAYGIQAEEVNGTLTDLGDIASGLGMPLEQLTSLYGKTMSQNQLYVQDLEQFTTAGVPMIQGLADMYGVTTDEVNNMVSAGKVGFPEVQRVIGSLTSEGGKFYNSMKEQSQTISGKIGNLGDAWQQMLNKVGQSQEGLINGSLDVAEYLIENYEQIGNILLTLIEIYGVYRAACLANIVLTQTLATTQMELGLVMASLKKSFLALSKSMNLNPMVLATTAIVGLGIALWNLADHTSAIEKAQRKFNESSIAQKQQLDDMKSAANGLISVIQSETSTQYDKEKAYEELQKVMPEVFENMDIEKLKLMDLLSLNKLVAEEMNRRERIGAKTSAVLRQKELDSVNTRLDNAVKQQATMPTAQNAAIIQNLQEEKRVAEESVRLANESVTKIEKIQSVAAEKEKLEKEKAKVHNKEYWKKQLENATSTLDQIDNKQLAILKSGNKKDIAKLPQAVVDQYGNAKNLKKQAEGALDTYENSSNVVPDNNSIREKEKQLDDLLATQAADRRRRAEDLNNKNSQAEIDTMEEGSKKILAQMMFNHERELQELDREKEDFLNRKIKDAEDEFNVKEELVMANNPKHVKGTFDSSKIQLTEKEKQGFSSRESDILKKQDKEIQAHFDSEKHAMNEYLKEYGSYQEKRKAITELYNEKIAKATTEGEKKSLGEEMKKTLSDVDEAANKKTSAFGRLFSDMKNSSVKDMRAIADNAEMLLKFVNEGKWDANKGADLGISKETFDVLGKSPEKIEKISENIKNVNEQADKSDTAFNKMGNGFKKLFSSGSEPKKLNEALSEIESGLNGAMQAGQFLSSSLSSLGDAFGSDALGGAAEGINVAMDAASSAMSGAKAGAMFGPWGAAAGAAIGLVSSLGSSLAKLHDAKHEKNIQNIQDQIEVLEKTYGNLGESLEKAYSADASKLIDQQNTLLAQQKVLINNQIAEEQSKKKADKGRIEDWQKQIEEIDKQIAGNKEKQIDAILGSDVKSAIDDFAQAYADAWAAGDDRAKSSKDLVKQMIKQMVMEAIKATTSQPMEALRQKLAGFFSDGVINAWEREQIEKGAADLTKQLDEQFGWADEYLQGDKEGASSQDSTRGGFESMSQETGSELNGRFTALQLSNEEIKNSMLLALGNMSALCTTTSDGNILLTEMRNLALMSNGHLEDIARYTKPILGFGEKLDKIERNTANL